MTTSEGLLHADLCLATLLSSEQCLKFERFRLQHVQIVNKTSGVKTKLTGNNAKVTRVNQNTLRCWTFPRSAADFPVQGTARSILGRGAGTLLLNHDQKRRVWTNILSSSRVAPL